MKTTRRNLLRFIGLGAAAAALAPAVSVPAEEEHDAEYEQRAAQYMLFCTRCGDQITDGYMMGDGDGSGRRFAHPDCVRRYPGAYKEWEPFNAKYKAGTATQADWDAVYERQDAVEQARADGSPSFFGATPVPVREYTAHIQQHGSPECLGCIYDAQLPPAEHQAALERYEARTSIGGAVRGEMGSEYTVPFDLEKHSGASFASYVYSKEPGFQMPAKGYP